MSLPFLIPLTPHTSFPCFRPGWCTPFLLVVGGFSIGLGCGLRLTVLCCCTLDLCSLGWHCILFGSDMVNGMDVPFSCEGSGGDIVSPKGACLITTPSSKHLGMGVLVFTLSRQVCPTSLSNSKVCDNHSLYCWQKLELAHACIVLVHWQTDSSPIIRICKNLNKEVHALFVRAGGSEKALIKKSH